MKTAKKLFWPFLAMFAIFLVITPLKPFSFDGRMTPSWVDYTPTLTNGDFVWGSVFFMNGFNVATDATVVLKLSEPVYGSIFLGERSTMWVNSSLEVFNGITMAADSTINHFARSIEVLAGTITAPTRGYINNYAWPYTESIIKVNGINLGGSCLVCHNIHHNTTTWDFSNGPITCGSPRGGDADSEYGLYFKGHTPVETINIGIVYLKNANFPKLWQNGSGVPQIRFFNMNRLNTYNVRFGIAPGATYTLSGIEWSGWFYPENTSFGASGNGCVLNFNLPTLLTTGGNVTFERGLSTFFQLPIGLAAGPITFNTTDLTFTQTANLLWASYFIDGRVNISGQNNTPLSISNASFEISSGAIMQFNDCNVTF